MILGGIMRLLLVACLMLFISCGKQDNRNVGAENLYFNSKECEYSEFEGINYQDEYEPSREIRETSFNKKYDISKLKPILKASAESSANYIKKILDVEVYKISGNPNFATACNRNGRPSLNFLQIAPEVYQYIWKHISGNSQGSILLGLYLESGNALSNHYTDKPVILLNEHSGKWTLVHEMMHHLFRDKVNNTYRADKLQKDLEVALNKFQNGLKQIQNYRDTNNYEYNKLFNDTASKYKELYNMTDQIVTQFPLEEIIIESILLKEAYKKNLLYIDSNNFLSAVGYMQSNAQIALEFYEQMERFNKELNKFKPTNRNNVHNSVSITASVNLKQKEIFNIISRAIEYSKKPKNLVESKLSVHDHKKCSHGTHSKILEDFLAKLKTR